MKKRREHAESALLFDWTARDRSGGRLLLAALVTFGAFVALFVGFRILTPDTRPGVTRPQQVLVLNPEIPAERALIHKAMDRSFALIPTDSPDANPPEGVRMPAYRPGIAAYELKPNPISSSAAASTRPQFFALDIDVESPVPAIAPAPVPEPRPTVLRAVLEGEAASRLTESIPLAGIPLVDPSRPRFRLAVGPRGQVLMALPLVSAEDPKVMEQLHAALMGLRFAPAKAPVEWSQATFQWEQAPPP